MFKRAFSGFSVVDLAQTKAFYSEALGLKVAEQGVGLAITLPGGGTVFAYPKRDHEPATFTILNFEVEQIDEAVDELTKRGVQFEHYPGMWQDERGIMRPRRDEQGVMQDYGPPIAWFKDPSGNILSVIETAE